MDLKKHIEAFHTRSDGTYGCPSHLERPDGYGHPCRQEARGGLMHEMGICGVSRRKSTQTTVKAHQDRKAPDLVKRDFTVATVNKLWLADITYVPTYSGFLYLSVVLDALSCRVVGWAMATHLQSELVLSALNMVLYQRRPEDVIHHSDQGVQYISIAFGKRCREAGVRPSIAYHAPMAYEKLHQSQA